MVGKVAEVEATPVLRSVLRSLGQMKYLHTPLLEAIMTWYTRDLEAETSRMGQNASGNRASVCLCAFPSVLSLVVHATPLPVSLLCTLVGYSRCRCRICLIDAVLTVPAPDVS